MTGRAKPAPAAGSSDEPGRANAASKITSGPDPVFYMTSFILPRRANSVTSVYKLAENAKEARSPFARREGVLVCRRALGAQGRRQDPRPGLKVR